MRTIDEQVRVGCRVAKIICRVAKMMVCVYSHSVGRSLPSMVTEALHRPPAEKSGVRCVKSQIGNRMST